MCLHTLKGKSEPTVYLVKVLHGDTCRKQSSSLTESHRKQARNLNWKWLQLKLGKKRIQLFSCQIMCSP